MTVNIHQLPIPHWDLHCPECNYALVGLADHRCPECGNAFDITQVVKPWTRLRDPLFSGNERPLPDFGLDCGHCGEHLAGAKDDTCPHCGKPFELPDLNRRKWIEVQPGLVPKFFAATQLTLLLDEAQIPYMKARPKLDALIGGQDFPLVASEFYLELLWRLRQQELEQTDAEDWTCACGADVPGHFSVCWQCEADRPNT